MGINLRPWRKPNDVFSVCKRHPEEQDVQNGLALTPGQMQEMTNRGIPIAPQNLGVTYEEGSADLKNYEVSPEYIRGVDIGELWELRESTNKRFKDKLKDVKPEGAE